MWRAYVLAIAIACGASVASACEDSYNIEGIVYDDVPVGTPPSAIVLDVEFEHSAVAQWRGGIIEARVRRVIQGEFIGERVRVGMMYSSCLYPFAYGREGLIIGHMREGFEEFSAEAEVYPTGERVISRWRFGFEGSWFQPIGESHAERRDRTGVDPYHLILERIEENTTATGDYDGDGATDDVGFFEDQHGNLAIGVERATDQGNAEVIWGGDISSLPRFTFRTAPPGRYITDCEAYGPDCGGEAPTRTLTHDGIIVEGLDDQSRTLYFWSGGKFKDVSILEPRP